MNVVIRLLWFDKSCEIEYEMCYIRAELARPYIAVRMAEYLTAATALWQSYLQLHGNIELAA